MKYTEEKIPSGLHLKVVHLHQGNASRNQLKHIGKTNAKYVTLAKLVDEENRVVAKGRASCSQVDAPRRDIGRAIAVGRALKNYFHPPKITKEKHATLQQLMSMAVRS